MKRLLLYFSVICCMLSTACENSSNDNNIKVVIDSPTEVVLGMYSTTTTISYHIIGVEDATANVTMSADWLRISEHMPSSLVIETETNDTGGSRMAAITLSYGNSSTSVVINQSGEAIDPIITSLSDEEINLERAGSKVSIKYMLENTNPVDYIYAKTSADWIYSIDTTIEGEIILGVATNTTAQTRTTSITVGYGTASFTTKLNQKGDGDISFNATTITGEYLGDALTPGIGNYWFVLSDRGFKDGASLPNGTYYRIDAYGPVYNGFSSMVPIANGTYTFDQEDSLSMWTFTAEYSGHWVADADGVRNSIKTFESGSMVVKDGQITLDLVIDGEHHHVEYLGSIEIEDEQDSVKVYSTLDGDYEADLSNHSLVYECYGDFYEFGFTNWMFVIIPNNGIGDCFQFDIITGYVTEKDGFYGDYTASDYLAKWSFIPGWTNQSELLCSWYFKTDQSELAPFRDGEMSIKDNGDGTVTVNINVKDDLRNTITAKWTGVPQANK